ncbi:MAG: hypothetical protein N3B16_01540 [Candidatus Aminicenantes bacterium]|nr:hypothetical protein [Candidatus Aminicenantes bacterium]
MRGEDGKKIIYLSYLLLVILIIISASAKFQKIKEKVKLPGDPKEALYLNKLLKEDPPRRTSLDDAVFDISFLDGFDPPKGAPMIFLPQTPGGDLPLLPGLWEEDFQSYCLMAGTYAPG